MTTQAPPLTVAIASLHDGHHGLLVPTDRMVMVDEELDPWEVRWVVGIATEMHQGGPMVDAVALAARRAIPLKAYARARAATTSATVMAGLLEVPLQALASRWMNLVGEERRFLDNYRPAVTMPCPSRMTRYHVAAASAPVQRHAPAVATRLVSL